MTTTTATTAALGVLLLLLLVGADLAQLVLGVDQVASVADAGAHLVAHALDLLLHRHVAGLVRVELVALPFVPAVGAKPQRT